MWSNFDALLAAEALIEREEGDNSIGRQTPAAATGGFGVTAPAAGGFGTTSVFGRPAAAPTTLFGAPPAATGGFGVAPASIVFGAPAPATRGLFGSAGECVFTLFNFHLIGDFNIHSSCADVFMCSINISTAPASSLFGSAASASTFGAIPAGGGLFGSARGENHDCISLVGFMSSFFC